MTEESAFDCRRGLRIFVLSTLFRLHFGTIQPPVLYALGFPSSRLYNMTVFGNHPATLPICAGVTFVSAIQYDRIPNSAADIGVSFVSAIQYGRIPNCAADTHQQGPDNICSHTTTLTTMTYFNLLFNTAHTVRSLMMVITPKHVGAVVILM